MSRREPSSFTDTPQRRFTLPKSRILRGRQKFKRLFAQSSLISSPSVNLRFSTFEQPGEEFRVAFIAPKKIGPATQRSRAKRLLRESFRLNQHLITDSMSKLNGGLHCAFLARHTQADFEQVQQDLISLLTQLHHRLFDNKSSF